MVPRINKDYARIYKPELNFLKQQKRRKVLEAWREMKLDAIICPGGAFPAPPLKSADLLLRNTFSLFFEIKSQVYCYYQIFYQ